MRIHLLERRKGYGWTQEEAARRAGIGLRQYLKYEKGHSFPGVEIALRLARAFDCLVEDLYQLENGD